MSASTSELNQPLNDCGCCDGLDVDTPLTVFNRPGLDAIAYRIGQHPDFKASMLARLSSSDFPGLQTLKTRSDQDFTIALLDAWSMVADVLTFYDQYHANEKYLRTADERLSIVELARLIGYRPHPGVAASTRLAFTMDEMEGSPKSVVLPIGTKVQSTPEQDQSPQIYETVEEIDARIAWNRIRPRLKQAQFLSTASSTLVLGGVETGIQVGNGLLFHPTGQGDKNIFAVVSDVDIDQVKDTTTLAITPISDQPIHGFESMLIAPPIVGSPPLPQGNYLHKTMSASDLEADASEHGYAVQDVFDGLSVELPATYSIWVFRQSASTFGHNAPAWNSLPESLIGDVPVFDTSGDNVVISDTIEGEFKYDEDVWPGGSGGNLYRMRLNTCPKGNKGQIGKGPVDVGVGVITEGINISLESEFLAISEVGNAVGSEVPSEIDLGVASAASNIEADKEVPPSLDWLHLDAPYKGVNARGPLILREGDQWASYRVNNVSEITKACFTITAKVTRLGLDDAVELDKFSIRGTQAYIESELLPLADVDFNEQIPLGGSQDLELDGFVDGLFEGQQVVLSGQLVGGDGKFVSEFIQLDKVEHELIPGGATHISFSPALQNNYIRQSVVINANVAAATHGETTQEVLGSGNATQEYQSFDLKQMPLTHVSAATPSGEISTLEVRVNDIKWHETDRLYGAVAEDRIFVINTDDDQKSKVIFGDGKAGARLPSGQNNIRAIYRKGLGLEGLVGAGQLNMLMSRPLGLKEVTNPHASSGAADPESRNDARDNAPLTVLTLDRAVSLRDFEDFSRAFAGISKALAVAVQAPTGKAVHITIAGPQGAEIDSSSQTYENLLLALSSSGDPLAKFEVQSYRPATFRLAAKVIIHTDYLEAAVLADVEASLRHEFGFEQRQFGQPVSLSEVVAIMQSVQGVVSVDLDYLYRGSTQMRHARLNAGLPGLKANGKFRAAELLTLHPGPLDYLEEIK